MNQHEIELALEPLFETASDNLVTILFANDAYTEIAFNWVASATRVDASNYWFIALDEQIHAKLKAKNIPNVLVELEAGDLSKLWILRIQIFKILVMRGVDFVHTDADAVWLKNPIELYGEELQRFDLIASQGTIWPPTVHNEWGFVLCCGYFMLKATPNSMKFLDDLEKDVALTGDDQVSLNQVLLSRKVRWKIKAAQMLNTHVGQILVSQSLLIGKGKDIKVGLIPFMEIPRIPVRGADPVVLHPLAPKSNEEKKELFKQLNIWYLD